MSIHFLRKLYSVAIFLAMVACSDDDLKTVVNSEVQPIQMLVNSTDMHSSRTLINTTDLLKTACTPTGGGKSIGIWSAYKVNGYLIKNILGNPDGDVTLTYQDGTDWDNYQGWTYGEEAALWTPNAEYTFNAYFPKEAINEISSSDETTFVGDYNTEHYQEDLMMAYAYANTAAPNFNASTPVELNMLHTLAALQFKFMFMNADGSTYKDEDVITACWLENTVSGTGLATTGVLAFGTVTDGNMEGEHIHWYHEDHPEPSSPGKERRMYVWEGATGVPFSSRVATKENPDYTPAVSHSTGNQLYSSNNGWILTIPQETDGTTILCFKLNSTGNLVHHVALPAATYEAGYRYTYNIRFGQSEVTVTLKIADWNELKSTHNIPL